MCILRIHFSKENIIGHYIYIKNKPRQLPHTKGYWDDKKKLEAVTTYLALGNLNEVSRMLNIPSNTLRMWKTQEWWKELVDSIQSGEGQRTDNKMSKTIDKALDLIMDRLEEGDYQYDQKTGRVVKIPLKARDLERISSGLFDKRQLIRKQPTNIKIDDLTQKDRLLMLAEQFAKFAGKIVREERVVKDYYEGEFSPLEEENNAIHDQREERLQEGAVLGTQEEAQSSEEQGTA